MELDEIKFSFGTPKGIMTDVIPSLDICSDYFSVFENIDFSEFTKVFRSPKLPTIGKAAELMGIFEDDIRNILKSKGKSVICGSYLDAEDVQILADKYVDNLRRYYNNCISHMPFADDGAFDFSVFCRRYSISGRTPDGWKGIDVDGLRDTFIYELTSGTSLFDIFVWRTEERPYLIAPMKSIVQSLLYHMKVKTRRLSGRCLSGFVIGIILANHFHIFTSESDSNFGTNSSMGNFKFKFPQNACQSPMAA